MKKNIDIKVCDFCVEQHLERNKDLSNFKYVEKVEVAQCIYCWKSMCRDCLERSIENTKGSCLAENWFYLCADCIQTQYREWDFRQVSQKIYSQVSTKFHEDLQFNLQLRAFKIKMQKFIRK